MLRCFARLVAHVVLGLAVGLAVGPVVGALAAQTPTPQSADRSPPANPGPWRIGVLYWHDSPNDTEALAGLRQALLARGKPHELVVRSATEDADRAAALLGAFEAEGCDLVVPLGTQASLLARRHLTRTPIVFTAVTNPVESGVVADWDGAGPGSRIAGNSNWIDPDTLLHVFRLAVPALDRLGVLRSEASGVVSAAEVRGLRRHLQEAGDEEPSLTLDEEVVERPEQLEAATRRLLERGADAVWIPIDFTVYENLDPVTAVTHPAGVPLVSSSLRAMRQAAVAGVLVDYEMLGERAAVMALEVLEHGRDPGLMPVGRMRGYQVVVNLGAARRARYEAPLSLIVLADRIFEKVAMRESLPPDLGPDRVKEPRDERR